jgi:phage terminase large subunit-like protein
MNLADVDLSELTDAEIVALSFDWRGTFARPDQILPPALLDGTKDGWFLCAGRGYGKTRVGAETIRECVETHGFRRVGLIAPTAADARDVMVEGESGILAVSPPWMMPLYEPSKRRLTWPNGAVATLYSADEPDRLRGPQHDLLWGDEVAAWRYPEAWDMALFGLRLGDHPLKIATSTPKPTRLVKDLVADPQVITTTGSTFDNAANLAPSALRTFLKKYEGTRLGLQELYARILDDNPNALFKRANIEIHRVGYADIVGMSWNRVVVAVDPAVTSNLSSDETGIICAARCGDHFFILDDASLKAAPAVWAKSAVATYRTRQADRIVAEVNNGGDLVEATIRTEDKNASYQGVRASRGKAIRAEPVAALYEQGRVHHVGIFGKLEDQMTDFDPNVTLREGEGSPDRMDALVWALTALMENDGTGLLDYYAAEAAKLSAANGGGA